MPWSTTLALAFAESERANATENYHNMCDHFVAECYGFGGSGYTTALEHWNAVSGHRSGTGAPAGSLYFWDGGDGHVALADGRGNVYSNDIRRDGKIDLVPIGEIAATWGKTLLGWVAPTPQTFAQSWGVNPWEPGGRTRTMYDAVSPANIPAGASLVAGYADGLYANIPEMRARFPHATVVSIAVRWTTRAQVLDVETGDATPAQAVDWCRQTMADKPNPELTVYCNTSTWPSVRQAFQGAGVTEPQYWVAAYDNDPAIPAGAVAKQWKNTPGYDVSSVAAFWPGVDAAPTPTPSPVPQEDDMPSFTVPPGSTDSGVAFAQGAYTNVAFFCDNTRKGGANDPGARLRVVIWQAGKDPYVLEAAGAVVVKNSTKAQQVVHFPVPAAAYGVTVEREDKGAYAVYAEVSKD